MYKSKLRIYFLGITKMKIKIIYHCLHKSLLHIFYKYRSSINVICFLKSSITRTIFIFWFIKGHCFYVSVLYMLLYLICNYIRFSYLFFKRLNWILGRYVLVKYPRVLDTYQIYIHEANESMMFQWKQNLNGDDLLTYQDLEDQSQNLLANCHLAMEEGCCLGTTEAYQAQQLRKL